MSMLKTAEFTLRHRWQLATMHRSARVAMALSPPPKLLALMVPVLTALHALAPRRTANARTELAVSTANAAPTTLFALLVLAMMAPPAVRRDFAPMVQLAVKVRRVLARAPMVPLATTICATTATFVLLPTAMQLAAAPTTLSALHQARVAMARNAPA
jgi:hypothetical protein